MRRLPKDPKGTAFGLTITPKPAWIKQAFRDLCAEHPELASADDARVWPNGPTWTVTAYWGTRGESYPLTEPAT